MLCKKFEFQLKFFNLWEFLKTKKIFEKKHGLLQPMVFFLKIGSKITPVFITFSDTY